MAGLVPAIHAVPRVLTSLGLPWRCRVDARIESGHDGDNGPSRKPQPGRHAMRQMARPEAGLVAAATILRPSRS